MTNSTAKQGIFGTAHYDTSQLPFTAFQAYTSNGVNQAYVGGGTAYGNAATSIIFNTAANSTTAVGTERMRINSAGSVGIGTSDPENGITYASSVKSLSVHGSGDNDSNSLGLLSLANNRATASTGDLLGVVDFVSLNNGAGLRKIGARISSSLTGAGGTGGFGGDLRFFTKTDDAVFATSMERMRITSSGNIGIGTTNPAEALHINTAPAAQPVALGDEASLVISSLPGGGGNQGILGSLWFGGGESGGTDVNNSAAGIVGYSPSDFSGTSREGELQFHTTGNGQLTPSERVRITSSGNVGVGTTSPGAKLEVTGGTVIGTGPGARTINVASFFTPTNSSTHYIHIRTPFKPAIHSNMYYFKVTGHEYGSARDIEITYTGYSYIPSPTAIYSPHSRDPSGALAPAQYIGSDGNIYLRFKPASIYYLTISVDSMYVGNGRIVYPGEVTISASTAATL